MKNTVILAAAFCAAGIFTSAFGDVLIENVTLIDGTGAPAQFNVNVLIEGDRFARISHDQIETSENTQRINGAGKFLIPGLIDTHVHLRGVEVSDSGAIKHDNKSARQALASFLYSGVTSIYDAGNDPDFIFGLRKSERKGAISGPRIFATGGIVTYPESHGARAYATLIDGWPGDKSLVDEHISRMPDMVKFTLEERGWGARPLIPLLPVEYLEGMVKYYNDHGIRTTVHTSSELRARQAIFAGVDSLAHPVIQGPVSDEFVRMMAVKKTPMSTTLTIGENYSRLAENPDFLDQPLYRASLSEEEISTLKNETREQYDESRWTWWMKIMTPVAQENLRKIHMAGGVIALGTDQTIGAAVHREAELLEAAGISAFDIIKIATYNGALYLGLAEDVGSIEVGKLGDAVLLDKDPATSVENLKAISAIIKNGELVDRAKLPVSGVKILD